MFFDVDGTLLDVRHQLMEVTSATKASFRQLKDKGDVRIICTGRSHGLLPSTIVDLEPDGYSLCAGAYVRWQGEILRNVTFPKETLAFMMERFAHHETILLLECGLDLYSNQYDTDLGRTLVEKLTLNPDHFTPLPKAWADLPVNKISVTFLDETAPDLFEDFTDHGITVLPQPIKNSYDITLTSSTKREGLEAIVNHLKLGEEDTILAFGDSYNDIQMLSFADIGVAMGDAPQEVKAVADKVTETVMEDGVARELERQGLVQHVVG